MSEELARDEGRVLTAYKDSVGLWTIGVGHLLGPHARMTSITDAECDALLAYDIIAAEMIVRRLVPDVVFEVTNPDKWAVRYRALVNMAFNLGSRLEGFHRFLTYLHAENWPAAAAEMMDSKWADQVGKRAERLRDMILTGKDVA